MGNYWRQDDYWGEAEYGDVKPNGAELARMREELMQRAAQEPVEAPSGQGCALAFIVMALVIMAAVFFWWWWG
jgi:hypothetical protein